MNSPVDSHNRAFTIQSLLKHMSAKPEAVVLDFNPSPGGRRVMWLFVFNIVLLGQPGTHNETPTTTTQQHKRKAPISQQSSLHHMTPSRTVLDLNHITYIISLLFSLQFQCLLPNPNSKKETHKEHKCTQIYTCSHTQRSHKNTKSETKIYWGKHPDKQGLSYPKVLQRHSRFCPRFGLKRNFDCCI